VTPQLLDRDIDRGHRSFLSAVLGEDVGHVHSRTTCTLLPIHDRASSQVCELMLCYCLYLHLSFCCNI
jgi:hypothetical protein